MANFIIGVTLTVFFFDKLIPEKMDAFLIARTIKWIMEK